MEISKQIGRLQRRAEADDLRKAVGKKKRDLMATMEGKFIDGCAASGTDASGRQGPVVADDRGRRLLASTSRHAACYALIAYRTAYLKANYPAEYMAAVISSVMSTKDKVPFFVNRCEEMGIEVLPPDVNSSDHGFVVSGNSIRFGLDAVKNVGHAAVETIIAAREADGPFESIWDFCERVDCARRQQARDRVPGQVRRARLDRRRRARGCSRCSPQAQSAGAEGAGGLAPRPGLDLRPRRRRRAAGRRAAALAAPRHPPVPGRGVRPARAAAAGEGDPGDVRLRPSAGRGARGAARAGRAPARRRRRRWPTAPGSRSAGSSPRRRRCAPPRRLRDVRRPRRPRGPARAVRPRRRVARSPRRSRSTAWS